MRMGWKKPAAGFVSLLATTLVFWVPFYFVIVNSFKNQAEAAEMNLRWPTVSRVVGNYWEVLSTSNYLLVRAFWNSSLLTIFSVSLMVIVCSMAGFVLQRRAGGRGLSFINFLILAGLMIPPAIVPTIWVLDALHLFKTLAGITLIEVALHFSFCVMLYQSFSATLPREIDESAFMDGCGGFRLFTRFIFPMLVPVTWTIVILQVIAVYNDFVNPLYFFPGGKNVTVQLTLYNFTSQFRTSWNLLFADVILISIPPLIMFIFFNKRIVGGMTAGAIKG